MVPSIAIITCDVPVGPRSDLMFAYVIWDSLGVRSQPIVLLPALNQSANQRVRSLPANPMIICYARSSLRKLKEKRYCRERKEIAATKELKRLEDKARMPKASLLLEPVARTVNA
jgi:hypothetical protein